MDVFVLPPEIIIKKFKTFQAINALRLRFGSESMNDQVSIG
jgi:hypothetical protein